MHRCSCSWKWMLGRIIRYPKIDILRKEISLGREMHLCSRRLCIWWRWMLGWLMCGYHYQRLIYLSLFIPKLSVWEPSKVKKCTFAGRGGGGGGGGGGGCWGGWRWQMAGNEVRGRTESFELKEREMLNGLLKKPDQQHDLNVSSIFNW